MKFRAVGNMKEAEPPVMSKVLAQTEMRGERILEVESGKRVHVGLDCRTQKETKCFLFIWSVFFSVLMSSESRSFYLHSNPWKRKLAQLQDPLPRSLGNYLPRWQRLFRKLTRHAIA
jgi:hypothetical protein